MTGPFMEVAASRVDVASLSKATLTDLSHVLENLIIEHELPGAVFTGFQVGRNWVSELERYERLVQPAARSVAVFASGNLGDTGQVVGFEVAKDSPLTQEWFIIALTEWFCCALFGADNPAQPSPAEEMDRLFDATWTFDPALVSDLCEVLRREVLASDPTRIGMIDDAIRRFPPRNSFPVFEARFHARVFETLEAGRRRWRRELVRSNEVQERLQQANAEAVRLERLASAGGTAASLAHELNNPLAAISLTAEVMLAQADTGAVDAATVQLWAHQLSAQSVRSGRMIRGILDLVRGSEAALETIELEPYLQQLTEEASHALRRRITLICPPGVSVLADSDRLRHIVTNLLENAVQASPNGSSVMITVGEGDDGHLDILVIDSGTGVADQVMPTLFEPFQTTHADTGGTGLGLALSRRFAEEQAGRLALQSTGPTGSVFVLSLPRVTTSTYPTLVESPPDENHAGQGHRVLVVDDDPDVRSLLGHLLRQSGWEVWTVGSAEHALRSATDRAYDAVVMDYRLGDGSTTATLLQALEVIRPGIIERTIIISGSLSRELSEDLPPVLLKPFSRAELEAAIAARIQHLR